MDQRPKCKSQNYTTLERKHKSKFRDLGLGKDLSSDEWIKKIQYTHSMEYYLTIRTKFRHMLQHGRM